MTKPDRAYISKRAQREAQQSIERRCPTRALCVLEFIDFVDRGGNRPAPTRKERRAEKRRQAKGHPQRTTSEDRRRQWHDKPDEREQGTREINRLVRKYRDKMEPEEGDVAPLLAAVAEFVVSGSPLCAEIPHLLDDFSLGEEHARPLQHWIMAKFGNVIREPDIAGYLAWREASLRDIISSQAQV
jgi:hypothetical protein